jgi:hypothetical protein
MSTTTTRRDAARAVGKFIGTAVGRKLLSANGYPSETTIFAVPETEPFDIVIDDVAKERTRVLIAIYFPERIGQRRFGFLMVNPEESLPPDRDGERIMLGTGIDGHTSSIGTVFDMMSGRVRRLTEQDKPLPIGEQRILERLGARAFQPV